MANGMRGSARWLSVGAVLLMHVALYWYPFTLDPPRLVDNTARRLPDGAWKLDTSSRVTIQLPDLQHHGAYSIAVKALPAHTDQTGPARLLAVGSNPYEPSLMLGLDREEIVVRLPCADGENDAEWRVPRSQSAEVSVKFWPLGNGPVNRPLLAVNEREPLELKDQCSMDRHALYSLLGRSWTLGNVQSGHRPFVGQISALELVAGERRLDLLRESAIDAPRSYWLWPERLYQPESPGERGHWIAVVWHFLGFLVLAGLLEVGQVPLTAARTLLIATVFSAALFAGKFMVAGRHPSVTDMMLNLGGAAAGIVLCNRFNGLFDATWKLRSRRHHRRDVPRDRQ